MNIWFTILILIYALNVGINTARDGEPKKERYSTGSSLFGAIVGILLIYMAIKTGF